MRPILERGGVEIYRIEESRYPMLPVTEMFLDTDAMRDEIEALGPDDFTAESDRIVMSSSSYLVRSREVTILLDGAVGDGKARRRAIWNDLASPWFARLTSVVDPVDVDVVVCTHLHCDHVGWNTVRDADGRWRTTFPRARYLFNQQELDFIASDAAQSMLERNGDFYADSVAPVLESGQAEVVPLPYEVAPGVTLEHAPGDTPGHMIARISDPATGDAMALITGDALHHVLQVGAPGLTSRFCSMGEAAESTRRRLLAECADTRIPMLAGHVASHDLLWIDRAADGSFTIGSAPDGEV